MWAAAQLSDLKAVAAAGLPLEAVADDVHDRKGGRLELP
jgi:hypothetical protein